LILQAVLFFVLAGVAFFSHSKIQGENKKLKLYWFIPDGLRAENAVFNIYDWARDGELPYLKYLIENGSFGYSRPVFPSHTPVNYATLMTGTWPEKHGVADGPMRLEGYPLDMILKGGFSSAAKKVPPIWLNLEKENNLVSLLSVPGSTPPELDKGITIKGRWGNWGVEFPSVIFNSPSPLISEEFLDQDSRVLTFSHQLTLIRSFEHASEWSSEIQKKYPHTKEINLTSWGQSLFALVVYKDMLPEKVIFSFDKKNILFELKEQQWSEWQACQLNWQTKNDYNTKTPKKSDWESKSSELSIDTFLKIQVVRLEKENFFRIRIVYDSMNELNVMPASLSAEIHQKIGPMVDFVDNYPPQLIFFEEDKKTFLNEMNMAFDWHTAMIKLLIKDQSSNVVIHSIYNPNQMLTSRWWLPYLDPQSPRYNDISEERRTQLWAEVKSMYKKIDNMLGEIIANADSDSYIVFSSDHGVLPLWKEVRLNNLFAQKGWLKTKFSKELNESTVDWENSTVVFTQMNTIYINPNGLGGPYHRAHGPKYDQLRNEVISLLQELKDPDSSAPVLAGVWKWEEAGKIRMSSDRIGDLVVANSAYYSWTEHVTEKKEIFKVSLKGGYKQAVLNSRPELLTPFVIFGPKIKKAYPMQNIIDHADQYTTIMNLLNYEVPNFVQGKLISEVIE